MSESGPDSGDAGGDRWADHADHGAGRPVPRHRGYDDVDDYSTAEHPTTALPRPASTGSSPIGRGPGSDSSADARPTTAIPAPPAPPRDAPQSRRGGSTPVAPPRADRPTGYRPPVGPSWAPQGPYRPDGAPPRAPRSGAGQPGSAGRYGAAGYGAAGYGAAEHGPAYYEPVRHEPDRHEPDRYEPDRYDRRHYDPAGYGPDPEDAGPYPGRAPGAPDHGPTGYADRDTPEYDAPHYGAPRYDPRRDDPRRDDQRRDDQRQIPQGYDPADRPPRRPTPRGSHLPPYSEPLSETSASGTPARGIRSPRKLTVTRVAALRSRELTHRGVELFHRATTADGADKSGLTSLTYAVMANYAVDAALAVALAGTLFFAAATAESTGRVLLYLVITVAPFAVIAPFIGPLLDRLQSGRRLALALSSFGRALLAIVMAFSFSHFNPWVIYPCALGNLVLSKAFGVLKAALTPRVLPEQITLVKTNSRLTTFGMIAGGVAGVVAAGLAKVTGSPGTLFFTAACAITGGVLCLRIPAWVESTEGEVPVKQPGTGSEAKKGFPQIVTATLWANSMIRVETGFLALFIAFVVKSQYPQPAHSAFTQLLLLGVIGAAAGVGGFAGNTMGARLHLSAPETISIVSLAAVVTATLVAVLLPGLATAALVGFVGSTASSLAKVSLDSVIQDHLPEESRASGFGKSESVLQLGWVFGGVVGLLLGGVWTFGHANVYAIGFGTITALLLVGLTQSWLVRKGRSMFPDLPARPRTRRAGRE